MEAALEAGSSYGTDFTLTGTGTPQLSVASSARLLGSAPSYIDPPSFEETVFKSDRSRSQSATSGGGGMHEWAEQQQGSSGNHTPKSPGDVFMSPNGMEYVYDDSDNSIEKEHLQLDGLSDIDQQSDHTEYSHLAGANLGASNGFVPQATAGVFHHQLSLPRSAGGSSSGGAAPQFSFSEMVDNRLQAQSPDDPGSPLNYATYV